MQNTKEQTHLIEQPITPGQWHFDEETLIVTAGKSPGSPYIADCRFGALVHRAPNARLIASAPTLQASAERLADALRDALNDIDILEARQVLAEWDKAKGGAE